MTLAKRNKRELPPEQKKVDISVNGDAEELVRQHREVERKLCPLRINERTVILVPDSKCNEKYRREWMKRNGR